MTRDTYIYKIVLIGDPKVGKTSLRRHYMGETFRAEYLKTLKADFAYFNDEIDDYIVKFSIWDLAGQPEYDSVRTQYYAGAFGAILVFDVTDDETFYNLDKWIRQFMENSEYEGAPIYIAANKMDLYDPKKHIDFEEAKAYIESVKDKYDFKYSISFIKTSAKTGDNVKKAFRELAREIHKWKSEN